MAGFAGQGECGSHEDSAGRGVEGDMATISAGITWDMTWDHPLDLLVILGFTHVFWESTRNKCIYTYLQLSTYMSYCKSQPAIHDISFGSNSADNEWLLS